MLIAGHPKWIHQLPSSTKFTNGGRRLCCKALRNAPSLYGMHAPHTVLPYPHGSITKLLHIHFAHTHRNQTLGYLCLWYTYILFCYNVSYPTRAHAHTEATQLYSCMSYFVSITSKYPFASCSLSGFSHFCSVHVSCVRRAHMIILLFPVSFFSITYSYLRRLVFPLQPKRIDCLYFSTLECKYSYVESQLDIIRYSLEL